jgi:hypothetical protein
MLFHSAYYAIRILTGWDIQNGSEFQLSLERRTYLISTLMSYAFGFQLISLFLFIYTVDHLNTLFVGAMCAAGTLNVNPWGYPTLLMKVVTFLLAGLWLILNYTDNRAYDYPLIKKKYGMLLSITPFILMETILQGSYFFGLKPDVITSCCGTLFTSDSQGITSEIISFPHMPVKAAFLGTMAILFALGTHFYLKGKGGCLFSLTSLLAFLISMVALISFFCLYFYELPTHHCPFCILQREYGYVGYLLHMTLFSGVVSGVGVGMILPFRKINSLREAVPSIQRKLAFVSIVSYATFTVLVLYQMVFSNLKM